MVSAAHTPQQRHAISTLAELVDTVAQQQLASPALLVVGEVVRCSPLAALLPAVQRVA